MTDILDELHPNQGCQFFFVTGGKNGYGNLTNFCHVFDEAETDRRQVGQQVTQFFEYGLYTIYVPFIGQWRCSFGDRHDKKKVTTCENCNIHAKKTDYMSSSCLLHISFRNWDIHVNHTREYSQPC
jgi:hypothetical protein